MIYHIKNGQKILMADVSVQSDWNQTDETKKNYIRNKDVIENQIRELQENNVKIEELERTTEKIKEYSVTFETNGGDELDSQGSFTTYHNVFVIPSLIPTKQNQYFQGWSLNPEAAEADYFPNKMIILDDSITLYAVWGDEEIDFNDSQLFNPNLSGFIAGGGGIKFQTTNVEVGEFVVYILGEDNTYVNEPLHVEFNGTYSGFIMQGSGYTYSSSGSGSNTQTSIFKDKVNISLTVTGSQIVGGLNDGLYFIQKGAFLFLRRTA